MNNPLLRVVVAVLIILTARSSFASPNVIPAKACVILDADDSILFAKNASQKLPPASTVKLMTAMIALDLLDPEAVVTISGFAARTRSSRPRLRTGDQLTVSDLLHLALMKSTNSAAVALAEAAGGTEDAFVELMNRKALEIGANDTYFINASGLPGTGQHTTALDLTTILKKALTYPLIREIIGKKESIITTIDGRVLTFGNTDALLWYRDDIIGGKTGFTNNARHCFVGAMETEKGIIYTAVLGSPSRSRLWTSTSLLVDLISNPDLIDSIRVEDRPYKVKKRRTRAKRK